MDKRKLDYFKNKLLREKKKIIESKNNITKEEYGAMDMYYTETSNYDNHPGDIATEVFFKEQDQGFRNQMNDTLKDIDEALERVENNTYGVCENCNKKISEERLELIPYVKTCLECNNLEPKLEDRIFESLDDEYINKASLDPDGNVGYDREDAYQDVSYYNIVPDDPSFSTGDNMGLVVDEEDNDVVEDVENISQEFYDETLK